MIDRLTKLIDVKSIVTLTLTASFVAQVAMNGVNEQFMTIYTMIMGFYFGTQATKTTSV
jgi:hypothetical protein